MTHAKLGYEVLSALLVSQFKSSAANHHHSQSVLQPVASAAHRKLWVGPPGSALSDVIWRRDF